MLKKKQNSLFNHARFKSFVLKYDYACYTYEYYIHEHMTSHQHNFISIKYFRKPLVCFHNVLYIKITLKGLDYVIRLCRPENFKCSVFSYLKKKPNNLNLFECLINSTQVPIKT